MSEAPAANGLGVHECNNWEEARSLLADLAVMGFIFRGHSRREWVLSSTLERMQPSPVHRSHDEKTVLAQFKQHGSLLLPRGISKEAPTSTWLTLLQHYGGPTRLIDFSRSPYVATYFAFEEPGDHDRCIWAVHTPSVMRHALEIYGQEWGSRYPKRERNGRRTRVRSRFIGLSIRTPRSSQQAFRRRL